ncbi:MAG: hypothetical protein M3Q81_01725 [bacterium]|nr:hypothetical protein [bacterium]
MSIIERNRKNQEPGKFADGDTGEPKELKPVYRWLPATSFDELRQKRGIDARAVNKASYEDFADVYAEIEWRKDYIISMWQEIFTRLYDIIRSLHAKDENGVVGVFGGVGGGRNLVISLLLNKDLKGIGYDYSGQMLEAAKNHLTWDDITNVVNWIAEVDPHVNGWIGDIKAKLKLMKESSATIDDFLLQSLLPIGVINQDNDEGKTLDAYISMKPRINEITDQIQEQIVNLVKNRIKFQQGTHQSIEFPPQSVDLIIDTATYQHLSKEEVWSVVEKKIGELAVGGYYYFSLRVDNAPLRMMSKGRYSATEGQPTGRIFCDNELNPGSEDAGIRYYTTWSSAELASLHEALAEDPRVVIEKTWKSEALLIAEKPSHVIFLLKRTA